MPLETCADCGRELTVRPRIEVDACVYCFKCAKLALQISNKSAFKSALDGHRKELLDFQNRERQFPEEHELWRTLRNAETSNNSQGCVVGLLSVVGLTALGAAFGNCFAGIGLIAGFVITGYLITGLEDRKKKKFEELHPEPFLELEPQFVPPLAINPVFLNPEVQTDRVSRAYILSRDDYTCQSCGKLKDDSELEMHHVIPKAQGGGDSSQNLVTLCKSCHDREDWFGHKRAFPTTIVSKQGRRKNPWP